jgi:DNA-binding transcriptional MerR regulator
MHKLYYSISELSQLVDEETHILRYWEKEFDCLCPKKNRGGNRIYSQRDVEIVKHLKQLIRDEKLSLKGAKEKITTILPEIDKELAAVQPVKNPADEESQVDISFTLFPPNEKEKNKFAKYELIELRNFLVDLKRMIKQI